MNNKKFLLMNLVDQLEEDKVDSLISVAKGMVSATANETNFSNGYHPSAVREMEEGQYIITKHINESFN